MNRTSVSWYSIKQPYIHITGVPEREGGVEERTEKIFEEIMTEKFPNLMKTKNSQIKEAQQTPSRENMKKTTSRHIIIKLLKNQW